MITSSPQSTFARRTG